MNKKFVVFDIDGTLLTLDKEFLESTKEGLKALIENGHEIALATGRNYEWTKPVIDELGLDTYVLCNGSLGYVGHQLIHENILPKESLSKLIDVASENNDMLMFLTPEGFKRHFEVPGEVAFKTFESLKWEMPEFDNTYWETHPIIQASLLCKAEDLPKYEDANLKFVSWHEFGFDVIPKEGSKANTVLKIAQNRGYKPEDIIFFGDGMNDIELIEAAGVGVAMGNAVEEVKKRADFITDSCDDHGVYHALKKLELI